MSHPLISHENQVSVIDAKAKSPNSTNLAPKSSAPNQGRGKGIERSVSIKPLSKNTNSPSQKN
jgi:hypothetical protein